MLRVRMGYTVGWRQYLVKTSASPRPPHLPVLTGPSQASWPHSCLVPCPWRTFYPIPGCVRCSRGTRAQLTAVTKGWQRWKIQFKLLSPPPLPYARGQHCSCFWNRQGKGALVSSFSFLPIDVSLPGWKRTSQELLKKWVTTQDIL